MVSPVNCLGRIKDFLLCSEKKKTSLQERDEVLKGLMASKEDKVVKLLVESYSDDPSPNELTKLRQGTSWIPTTVLKKLQKAGIRVAFAPIPAIVASYLSKLVEDILINNGNIDQLGEIRKFHMEVAMEKLPPHASFEVKDKNGNTVCTLKASEIKEEVEQYIKAGAIPHMYLQVPLVPYGKRILLPLEALKTESIAHEFAHAIDDLLEKDKGWFNKTPVSRSQKDPRLKALFQEYKSRVASGEETWSIYPYEADNLGSNSLEDYFAEGLVFYLYHPQDLKKYDPGLYQYMEDLLSQLNIERSPAISLAIEGDPDAPTHPAPRWPKRISPSIPD